VNGRIPARRGGFHKPRIAVHDEATGETVDLSRTDALRLLRRDDSIREEYIKRTRMAGQWYSPPEQRGRLILIGETARRILRERNE
jgi:hypothetical protein